MGNQECSVSRSTHECIKNAGVSDFPLAQGRLAYGTAEGGTEDTGPQPQVLGASLREPAGKPAALSVDTVGLEFERQPSGASDIYADKIEPDKPAKEHEFAARGQQAAQQEAVGSIKRMVHDVLEESPAEISRPAKTYFDLDMGEAPKLDAARPDERCSQIHTFQSGAVYDGEWLRDMRHGLGKQEWVDGTEYIGEWVRGRAHGKGRLSHHDGDVYTGEWINGRAHGLGIFEFQNGAAVFCGEFKGDLRDGVGEEIWQEGSVYRGNFRRGEKFGYGVNTWPDDSARYSGRWIRNELKGPGRFEVEHGQTYQGQWAQSSPSGMGKYEFSDGSIYAGQYELDKKHGFGILIGADGIEERAFWEHGSKKARPLKE